MAGVVVSWYRLGRMLGDLEKATKQRNTSPDIVKVFAFLAMVSLHVVPPEGVGAITNNLSRFAVPIFFMVSGYFIYNTA